MFRLFFSDNISKHKFAIIFYLWSVVCNSLSYFMCSPSSPFNLTNLLTTHSRMFTTDHTIHITLCFLFFTTFFFVKNGKLPDPHHISLSSIFFPLFTSFWLIILNGAAFPYFFIPSSLWNNLSYIFEAFKVVSLSINTLLRSRIWEHL